MTKRTILILAAVIAAVGVAFALTMPASPLVKQNVGNDRIGPLESAGASLVDVRTPSEFEAGHIASAVNVPLDTLAQAAASWDKSKPVIVYCATGARSAEAATVLSGLGFKQVYNLERGVVAYDGKLVSGQSAVKVPTGAGVVKTSGKPVFIEFSTDT